MTVTSRETALRNGGLFFLCGGVCTVRVRKGRSRALHWLREFEYNDEAKYRQHGWFIIVKSSKFIKRKQIFAKCVRC